MLRSALSWKNAWRIRIVALGCIVLFVGVGSQLLVNAVAANTDSDLTTLAVSAYTHSGPMADGNWTHAGACAVSLSQFPLGTVLALYDPDGSFDRQCTAEDTNASIEYGSIRLAMPDNTANAQKWGTRNLLAKALRTGWGQAGIPVFPTATPVTFPPHSSMALPPRLKIKTS